LIKIDLGSSFHKLPGYIGVDIMKAKGVDVYADAQNLPFRDSSIDEIYSSHCIEHIDDQLAVIRELYRVCKPDALMRIIVPHFSNPCYYDDLTHRHHYSTRSFEHYNHQFHTLTGYSNYLPEVNIKFVKIKLNYWPKRTINSKSFFKALIIKIINWIFSKLANINHFLCERLWCYWVGGFYEVDFIFQVLKERK